MNHQAEDAGDRRIQEGFWKGRVEEWYRHSMILVVVLVYYHLEQIKLSSSVLAIRRLDFYRGARLGVVDWFKRH